MLARMYKEIQVCTPSIQHTGRWIAELEASLVYPVSPCLKSKEISTCVPGYEVEIGGVGNRGKRAIKEAEVPFLCSKQERGGDTLPRLANLLLRNRLFCFHDVEA